MLKRRSDVNRNCNFITSRAPFKSQAHQHYSRELKQIKRCFLNFRLPSNLLWFRLPKGGGYHRPHRFSVWFKIL